MLRRKTRPTLKIMTARRLLPLYRQRSATPSPISRRRAAAASSRTRQTGCSCAFSQVRRFGPAAASAARVPPTNFSLTGDACAIAARHGIALEHMDYVQIHPTSLYPTRPGRAFLISESCRGEGAVLLDANGNRFTDRSRARARHIPADGRRRHGFRAPLRQHAERRDHGALREYLQAVPRGGVRHHARASSQHYFMGGVRADRNSATDMPAARRRRDSAATAWARKNLHSNSPLERRVRAQRSMEHAASWECGRTYRANLPRAALRRRRAGVQAPLRRSRAQNP